MNDQAKAQTEPRMVVLGRIAGVYGVRGWVHVYSETDPIENILRYRPWHLGQGLRNLYGAVRHIQEPTLF